MKFNLYVGQRWVGVGSSIPVCPTATARKNYQRLFHRYREIATKLGPHEFSAYG
jgi:hypothetical protein